jgi:hypothetical protein
VYEVDYDENIFFRIYWMIDWRACQKEVAPDGANNLIFFFLQIGSRSAA